MATSASGGSSGGLIDDQRYAGVDEKKRKRMISNKESARRSRMRKQQVLLDLSKQIRVLQESNKGLQDQMNKTWEDCMKVESENNVMRAQIKELTDQIQSLTDLIKGNMSNKVGVTAADGASNSNNKHVAAFSVEDQAWVDSLLLFDDIDIDFLVPIDNGINDSGDGSGGSSSGGGGDGGGSCRGGSGNRGGDGGDNMLVEPWMNVSPFEPPSPTFFQF